MLTLSFTDFHGFSCAQDTTPHNMPKSTTRKATTAAKSKATSSTAGDKDDTITQLMARLERLEAERATPPVASTSGPASVAQAAATEQPTSAPARKTRGRAKKQPAPATPAPTTPQLPAEELLDDVLSAAVRQQVTSKFAKVRHARPQTFVESSSEDSDEEMDTPPRHVAKRPKHATSKLDHWPNDHIYAQSGLKIDYEDLSWEQFFAGYLAVTRLSKHSMQPAMYSHLEVLAEDMAVFGYEPVRRFHGIWLQELEMARVSWTDIHKRDSLRRSYIWNPAIIQAKAPRANPAYQAPRSTGSSRSAPTKANICIPFNKGECTSATDHAGVEHICSYCTRALHRRCFHPEAECLKKVMAAKSKKGF
jgi:hypothetical protein